MSAPGEVLGRLRRDVKQLAARALPAAGRDHLVRLLHAPIAEHRFPLLGQLGSRLLW